MILFLKDGRFICSASCLFLVGLMLLSLTGCGTTEETVVRPRRETRTEKRRPRATQPPREVPVQEYPSPKPQQNQPAPSVPQEKWVEVVEKTMGFKVQLFSSTSLDDAARSRDRYRELLEGETIEMVYNAPYYKLRVGNFTDKGAAEEYRDMIQSKGITEAWVVRDQIVRTILKKANE